MSAPTAHVLSEPVAVDASGPGALSGHEVRCSCGFVARTSLSARVARQEGDLHYAWAVRTGR